MSKKPIILIIDDEGKVTEDFKKNHGNDYMIESINKVDIGFIRAKLEEKTGDNKPDLILTDLKHEKDGTFLDMDALKELKRLKIEIKSKMKFLSESINQYNEIIRPITARHGINVLKTARKVYGDNIPVVICTGTTHIAEYMNCDLHQNLLELNAELMQMRLGKAYESAKIERLLDSKNKGEKPFILAVFGKEYEAKEFITNHEDEYRIKLILRPITYTEIASIKKVFEDEYSGDNRPDLILTDSRVMTIADEPIENEVYAKAKVFKDFVDGLNSISGPAYGRHGIQVLETVRKVYRDDTPVAIYTGFGIITEYKNREVHTKVVELNGEWFQKKLGKDFESKKIEQLLNKKKGHNQ
jgi:CheY-like chemotaxis protein